MRHHHTEHCDAAPVVPFTVYLNGFVPDARAQREDVLRQCPQAEVVLLDAASCDSASAPEAVRSSLAEGRFEAAAQWFAMQAIHARGGFYASPGVSVLDGADGLRHAQIFFSRSASGVSLHFFGGMAGDDRWLQAMDVLTADDAAPVGTRLTAFVRSASIQLLSEDLTLLPIEHSACCVTCRQEDAPVIMTGDTFATLCSHFQSLTESRSQQAHLRLVHEDVCRQRDRFLAERDEARLAQRELGERLRNLPPMTPARHLKSALLGLFGKGGKNHA
ncbi:MAG: hypothetical protein IKK21_03075 [Clostridia bacterium]|nr:hypothetical protein [Clostridia bacterium]